MEKGKGVMGEGRRWGVDLTDNSTSPSSRDFPDPPGFSRASFEQDDSTVSRQKKKAWEVAQAPFKNLMMMGFMMWMAGSTMHLFSIGITFSALWQPISALQGVGKGKMTVTLVQSLTYSSLISPQLLRMEYSYQVLKAGFSWNDPLDFRSATVNNISLLNFHSGFLLGVGPIPLFIQFYVIPLLVSLVSCML
ncbi:ER membrane protein complex subunit 4-like [Pyrus ussuriensis x Pyrus communis]|uniref:ER membrane protein complex subunit 4 n=1 Tax=Pyrus ussuriensis x Pyrus communis TaxID=2448454 RepID=A0A5N5F5X5_9ROSA|nr:ER membrane protein complex subunit 4-like [Pyrus ussuriensis x Pyrus communis]